MISIVRLPCISETHAWLWRAVSTVRCCLFLHRMAAKIEGAKSTSHFHATSYQSKTEFLPHSPLMRS
jgi:hypothetical protein